VTNEKQPNDDSGYTDHKGITFLSHKMKKKGERRLHINRGKREIWRERRKGRK
jgi:hypothetical protein